jgi:hypothetical protein
VVRNGPGITHGVSQTAGAPRGGGDIEDQTGTRGNAHLTQEQLTPLFINQLGTHPAIARGKTQVIQLQVGHNLAHIRQEQTPPQTWHLIEKIAQDVGPDVWISEELAQHSQDIAIEAEHLQELHKGGWSVALQQR